MSMLMLSQKPRLGLKILRGHFRALLRCFRALQTLGKNDIKVRFCIGPCLLTNKTYADGKGTSYEYTSDGKLSKRTWARKDSLDLPLCTLYSYTNTGEMVGIDYSDATPSISFTHDRLGRQKTVTDAQGSRTFNYDAATLSLTNEVLIADGVTNVLTRTQDSLGRAASISLFSASDMSNPSYRSDYSYSDLGRFLSVSSSVPAVSSVRYGYLPNSDLISGISNSVSSVNSVRGYENNRNLLTSVANRHGSTLISGFAKENDSVGRRPDRINTGSSTATTSFGYNARSELTSALMKPNENADCF